MRVKNSIKHGIKGIVLIVFLYIAFFSIQNFWQGYHDADLAFNFNQLGYKADIQTNKDIISLEEAYYRGVGQMRNSFVWLSLNCILAILIGYLYRGKNESKR